jgi:hypothetical protein
VAKIHTDNNIKDWGTDITVEGEGINLRLYLEDSKNIFSPGDTIKGKLIVENSSGGKRIKNAEIILRGIESTYASSSTRISTIETYKQKVEFNGGGRGGEESNSAPFEIHIPKEVKRSYKAVYSKFYWERILY